MSQEVVNLENYTYIHVLDTLTNLTRYFLPHLSLQIRLEVGPQKFVGRYHERLTSEIEKFVKLKPR